ncbi:hypothetical protein rpr22_CDSx591 [Rickettsia prowazekii str. Rp22]|uniref:Uncharacterized protein n=1 Tax=Rickettsia prowazekii (strain Rp22) TaxID=449216 RepID=D5AXE9_RICPP|nr:hypothetical protein rpr22_CDSx591 [Rickettsia prowazekii str. Rp22]
MFDIANSLYFTNFNSNNFAQYIYYVLLFVHFIHKGLSTAILEFHNILSFSRLIKYFLLLVGYISSYTTYI